jgi:hypothetical protein
MVVGAVSRLRNWITVFGIEATPTVTTDHTIPKRSTEGDQAHLLVPDIAIIEIETTKDIAHAVVVGAGVDRLGLARRLIQML